MHTGFVPNPNVEHPGYGSLIAHELAAAVPSLEIPPFVSVGGGSVGQGFLGTTWAPFVVSSQGDVKNLESECPRAARQWLQMLAAIENRFIQERRGSYRDHRAVVGSRFNSCQAASWRRSRCLRSQYLYERDTERRILDGVV